MTESPGTTGLIMNEPLLWEKSRQGRCGISIPESDVETTPLDAEFAGEGPDFPDLSEVDVVRHFTRLSQWNFGVDTGMYPLGSCTMKYNPKIHEKIAALPGFAGAHPMLPPDLAQGTLRIMYELERFLCEITGMDATTLQPAAGAHGELTAMLLFYAYHKSKGEKRTRILIPDTAHGTNPASAALCGYAPVPVTSGDDGVLSVEAVEALMDEETAGIMVTNPNTLGLFEQNIRKVAEVVHRKGGLVYGDGANMNAVMGIVKMGEIGIDAIHLNLHKTFSTPHGGGGPGAGPVCVRKHLEPFLPVPRVTKNGDAYALQYNRPDSIGKIHAFHGNFGILIRAYSYILSMGRHLKTASQHAVLSANYIKERLKDVLHLPYDRPCMHECVFTDKNQEDFKITTLDMAKRLMDYGFHPPTIYFPLVVHGAIMIEPTETEPKENLDQFIETFKIIIKEAVETPELLREAPTAPKVRRLDEATAARKPCLCG
ncbi:MULTISPECIES: aminomethyl-transferring glycine dehydrogenase subunit GcvPB [Desulfococcus]|uniref:glycine dehydrogenase (aminomethyl-transferring) n=1 Tax=Desulfococcus multivorans DSM 2059 TaxID=1121405 RepID=S7UZP7_DESML|nr:aminomethyl-transferring glycine dehydrogenase subunit GcvPB [Desulfococcus multivorans]AOY60612.1 GcvPB: glycine dehydrogenase (decarboxylating), glycine cleavage system P protein, subunit 2 [Desulfococcus multivorans]AQV02704.1 glycine dehydrogenase (aminomethyl-transferring) [Desulfococcus multivorans]EPR39679.1 Glycine cleavage system P-protein [Desulfococcus multivorans DSM 2059]SKA03931.1 glycine dehydrogenase (decarboxylating) beta subunit [Desulfococcus multivorans DSM 2059]